MKLLYLLFILPSVLGRNGFGHPHLKDSSLCTQWKCINTKLGLPNSLPPISQTEETLKRLLPEGPWQDVVGKALEYCYGSKRKQFSNTCPGQGILHCIVDQMNENCPEVSLRKDDACSPISSIGGLNYMFWQSRYENFQQNLPNERRPIWFLKNYYDTKCCDFPVMFNTTLLEECGFAEFINYHTHPTVSSDQSTFLDSVDPLDCCDMTDFIEPTWRSDCDFKLIWNDQDRLVLNETRVLTTEAPPPTTTGSFKFPGDVMILPQSCEKDTCVFKKMDIVKDTGIVDIEAYVKMLDNFTNAHSDWTAAKAKVVKKCLNRSNNYEAECEINTILACTMDVLSENCPHKTKRWNICKHGNERFSCQISSSKDRPKYRREICALPELIPHNVLSECGLESLYRSENVVVEKPKHRESLSRNKCKDTTGPATCIMNKMNVLNKYDSMDYFMMRNLIRTFTANKAEWSALLETYINALENKPMYKEYCGSSRRFLNVIDSMLKTCPVSKRKNTPQCNKIFTDIISTPQKAEIDEILDHVFVPYSQPYNKFDRNFHRRHKNIHKTLFKHGLLDHKTPRVEGGHVKPTVPKPVILIPVYLRPARQ